MTEGISEMGALAAEIMESGADLKYIRIGFMECQFA
jgi:hypothetical protein